MTETYHSDHPDVWRVNHAIEVLRKTDWPGIEVTISEARRQARPVRTSGRRDGYPTSTLSGARGNSDLTAVEAAADANVFGTVPPASQSLYDHLQQALAELTEAAGHATALIRRVELIRSFLGADQNPDRTCALCGDTGRPLIYGNVGQRLPTSRDLCEAGPNNTIGCYQVVAKNDGWPTPDQIAEHTRTGRWRYRTTA